MGSSDLDQRLARIIDEHALASVRAVAVGCRRCWDGVPNCACGWTSHDDSHRSHGEHVLDRIRAEERRTSESIPDGRIGICACGNEVTLCPRCGHPICLRCDDPCPSHIDPLRPEARAAAQALDEVGG